MYIKNINLLCINYELDAGSRYWNFKPANILYNLQGNKRKWSLLMMMTTRKKEIRKMLKIDYIVMTNGESSSRAAGLSNNVELFQ